jgi:cobalt-zinc-cadmium efflux system outer membrane protein
MIARGSLCGAAMVALVGCAPRDAGYRDTRALIADRMGYAPRWDAVDDDPDVEDATRTLLARPLSADSAVRIALMRAPDIQVAFEELGIARADLVEALRLPNPKVEGHVHLLQESQPFEVEIVATIDVIELVFLGLRKDAAEDGLAAARARVAGLVLDHAFTVKSAFYDWQAEEQMLELRRTVLAATRASLAAQQAIHEAGNVPTFELLSEQALYEDARLALAQTETALIARRQRLAMVMGVWGHKLTWRKAKRLPEPPHDEIATRDIEKRAIAGSLDLEEAKKAYASAASRADVAQAEGVIPELQVGAGVERESDRWEYGPQVELQVPLFYQGQGSVARAEADMRRAEQRHRGLGVRIRATARSARARLEAASATVRHYKKVLLPLRQRLVDEAERQHNAMNMGVSQLLMARRDQIETGVGYVQALRDYWIARAEVELLLAGRLPRGMGLVEAPAGSTPPGGGAERH